MYVKTAAKAPKPEPSAVPHPSNLILRKGIKRQGSYAFSGTDTNPAGGLHGDFSRVPVKSDSQHLPIQAKLKIGARNDRYEQEADRIAEQIMRVPNRRLQREAARPVPTAPTVTPRMPTRVEGRQIEAAKLAAFRRCQRAMFATMGQAFHMSWNTARRLTQTILAWPNPDMAAVRDRISEMTGMFVGNLDLVRVAQPGDSECSSRAGYVRGHRIVLCRPFFSSGAEQRARTMVHEAAHLAGIRNPGPGEGYCPVYDCRSSCPGGRNSADSWSHLVHCLSGQTPDQPTVIQVRQTRGSVSGLRGGSTK